MKKLWEELNLNIDFNYQEVDEAYRKINDKTPRITFAWKVLRDKYYSEVYRKYQDEDLLIRAGFLLDSFTIDEVDYYNIDLLTTPFDKLKDNISNTKNPVVLLSTGGFYPIHDGHIKMMEEAKKTLTENGYDVVGGYLSLSHEEYVKNKPYYTKNQYDRINDDRQYLKDNDWLMIDPWESIYLRTIVNFTDVINRLEMYLQKHIDKRIKVAYVFGGDNVEFMYCFEKQGLGVCLNRDGYNELFEETKKIKNNNMFFIDSIKEFSSLSSRDLRKEENNVKSSYEDVGNYLIRNELLLPLVGLINNDNVKLVEELQVNFLNKFMKLLSDCFDNKIPIKVINMENQLINAYEYLKDKNTINLDSYFHGTFDLEVSRLFHISSYQNKYIDLIGRLGFETIEEQVSKIKAGDYILVDDDSVTGRTLNTIKEKLPSYVNVAGTYLLANSITDKVFDVVDLRDFIIGVNNGGLVVKLPNGEICRAPYVMPYVNLVTRASIPPSKEKDFSIAIWKLNKDFYEKYNKNFKLKQADHNFRKLMKYVGFKDNDKLVDICKWHINKLYSDRLRIVEYNSSLRSKIVEYLKSIAIGEYGFTLWLDYLNNKDFTPYETGLSKFIVVLDNEDNIVATAGALRVDDETIKLNSFYIKKEYRSQKIGTTIYNKIVDFAKSKNYKHMILCTFDVYVEAKMFYKKEGFKLYKKDESQRWYIKEL
jgi:GNAT superfamily N-acetyltransferase/nicotinic acid mononucleotide adenylyltransferase